MAIILTLMMPWYFVVERESSLNVPLVEHQIWREVMAELLPQETLEKAGELNCWCWLTKMVNFSSFITDVYDYFLLFSLYCIIHFPEVQFNSWPYVAQFLYLCRHAVTLMQIALTPMQTNITSVSLIQFMFCFAQGSD